MSKKKPSAKSAASQPWSVKEAHEHYGFKRWGGDHFSVDGTGALCVHPMGAGRSIRILDVVKEAESLGLKPPLTIRVQDLLRQRVIRINEAFRSAIRQEGYTGVYRGVFPIKVNQKRVVVEQIIEAGRPYGYGLEAGSKPELLGRTGTNSVLIPFVTAVATILRMDSGDWRLMTCTHCARTSAS